MLRDKLGRFIKGYHSSPKTEFKKGQNKGIPRTEEVKQKISLANKGKPSWIKGMTFKEAYGDRAEEIRNKQDIKRSLKLRGRKHSPETILKMSIAKLGKKKSKETKRKMSLAVTGRKHSEKTKRKLSDYFTDKPNFKIRGDKSPSWKGGITPLVEIIRHSLEFKQWRKTIFERDNYLCQKCFIKRKYLHPHHKKLFSIIFTEFLQIYDQFSPIEDRETLARLAMKYKPFWEVNNGITFCKDCHKKIHKEKRYVSTREK